MDQIMSHHEGRFLSLREIDGWEFVTRPNATGVVGVLAFTTDRKIILVEQYRRPVKSRVIELCAGLVGDEEDFSNESVADCAQRELIEETGYTAGKMSPLLNSPTSAGMTDEMTYFFLAEECVKTGKGGGINGEEIDTHLVRLEDLGQFIQAKEQAGVLVDSKIHACLGAMHFLGTGD
jgi:ADP-ribose pyrophosphatase